MLVKVTVKQLGKKKNKLNGVDFELCNAPESVRALLVESVHTCVEAYNRRWRAAGPAHPLSDAEIDDMSEVGKIAFGINYGSRQADETSAVQTAIQAYEDGLVRIFLNQAELGGIDQQIHISEGDSLMFIKLTMLSGSMF